MMVEDMKRAQPQTNLEIILEELSGGPPLESAAVPGIIIGRVVAVVPGSAPLVDFPGNSSPTPLAARSTVPVEEGLKGRQVTLMFEDGRPDKPIIMGVLVDEPASPGPDRLVSPQEGPIAVGVDGRRLVLTAEEEIVLECGKASITLTRAGKVIIKGEYVLSRSAGANKIKGGSVQIN